LHSRPELRGWPSAVDADRVNCGGLQQQQQRGSSTTPTAGAGLQCSAGRDADDPGRRGLFVPFRSVALTLTRDGRLLSKDKASFHVRQWRVRVAEDWSADAPRSGFALVSVPGRFRPTSLALHTWPGVSRCRCDAPRSLLLLLLSKGKGARTNYLLVDGLLVQDYILHVLFGDWRPPQLKHPSCCF